ncbi:MAG: translation initiation factor IF-2 N-terminal domain-containing protein, partial [Actinomycetota bacterium]|nr:translation initiation factor IF-2 N-terminal domain-containing protein [Actinomycetota bacterium]
MSTPAGSAGGATTTPTNPALAELPAKVRVHALAKLLEVSSKDVLAALTDLGEPARGAQSSVARDLALRVADALSGGGLPVVDTEPEVVEAAVEAPEPEESVEDRPRRIPPTPVFASASPLFLPPEKAAVPARKPEPAVEEPVAVEPEIDDS